MGLEAAEGLLLGRGQALCLFGLNLEADARFSEVCLHAPLEGSVIQQVLLQLLGSLAEVALGGLKAEIFFVDGLLEEAQLLLVDVHEIMLGGLQLLSVFLLQLCDFSVDALLVAAH